MSWNLFKSTKTSLKNETILDSNKQDLELYWDPKMAKILEEWGEENVWNEIQMLLCSLNGKILDIACGTGITSMKLQKFSLLDVYGCDISDLLISKCFEKGLSMQKYIVCDATQMPYVDNDFHYSYSIGSLEHFTEVGISKFINESYRITSKISFHMLPTSKSEKNEGWMKTRQSFHNNSVQWWVSKFNERFDRVAVIRSKWEDSISLGYWFVCYKNENI